jgi:adenosylcobinamide-phosphate synthase
MKRRMIADAFAVTALALLIEAAVGYPDWLYRAIGHPVGWMGRLIAALDRRWNRDTRAPGVAAVAVVLAAVAVPAWLLWTALPVWALALLAASLPAQRSLDRHVADVAAGLRAGVPQGRAAVARIVGRDVEVLDGPGVARSAIESLAENFSDGIVAPSVYGCAAGLPGMALYKAVNTLDSMLGHRTPRHERFGWAAAGLDDVVNLPASRLSALWLVLAALLSGRDWRAAVRAVVRDARHHRSPNAGWPEAAMAGALGFRLAGPRVYNGQMGQFAWIGDGRAALGPDDIEAALRLYRLACALQWGAIALTASAIA